VPPELPTAAAPRYDDVIFRAIGRLDDPAQPYAEICRRVADHAQEQGFPRPSLVHLRRHVARERERRDALRELRAEAVARFAAGLVPDLAELALELRDANERRWRS
jgi:hypothetical protein